MVCAQHFDPRVFYFLSYTSCFDFAKKNDLHEKHAGPGLPALDGIQWETYLS